MCETRSEVDELLARYKKAEKYLEDNSDVDHDTHLDVVSTACGILRAQMAMESCGAQIRHLSQFHCTCHLEEVKQGGVTCADIYNEEIAE